MRKGRLKYLLVVLLSALTMVLEAQNQNRGTTNKPKTRKTFAPVNQMVPVETSGVDTLSMLDRFALRTNLVDWAMLIPNIGAEFDIRNTNWNRWTVGINLRYNWQTSHTYHPSMVYNLFEARIEGRQYWRARQIDKRENARYKDQPHKHFYDKIFSIRRSKVKHKAITWYRGLFASYNKYSILFGTNGHQGTAFMGGVTYGFVRPMFAFQNGNSIDLEFGVSGGVMYYKDEVYTHDIENDCYPLVEKKPAAILPMVNELRVGLVYRLGHVPVLAKYRYRRDVDLDYNAKKDDIRDRRYNYRDSVKNYEHDYNMILRKFWHVYDSIARVDKANHLMSIQQMQSAKSEKSSEKAKKEKKVKKAKASKKDSVAAVEPKRKEEGHEE